MRKKAKFVIASLIIILMASFYLLVSPQNKILKRNVEAQDPDLSPPILGETKTITESLEDDEQQRIVDQYAQISKPHWPKMPITYEITNCEGERKERIKEALRIITEETEQIISFEEGTKQQITLSCEDERTVQEIKNDEQTSIDTILKHEMPRKFEETNIYKEITVIMQATIKCKNERPIAEIHEIMHALGIKHPIYNELRNIMNPTSINCNSEITKGQKEELKQTYEIITQEEIPSITKDFEWPEIPVSYTIINCESDYDSVQNAIRIIERLTKLDLYVYSENPESQVIFECASYEGNYLEPHLDYHGDVRFPGALPEYYSKNGQVTRVRINLYKQNYELHEVLHGAGLVEHHGLMMTDNYHIISPNGDDRDVLEDTTAITRLTDLYAETTE